MGDLSEEILRVPKIIGADMELGNFILGSDRPGGTSRHASRALLAEIEGYPRERSLGSSNHSRFEELSLRGHSTSLGFYGGNAGLVRDDGLGYGYDPQEWGRKFLASNGSCAYIDLDHLELCTPEVRSAWDFVAATHAMLRLARKAQQAANAKQAPGRRIQVHANNSDGLGNSYGSHLNFLLTRRARENIFTRKLHQLLWLASYQASSIVFTGQGKVGSENGEPKVPFQLSQRADFVMTLVGPQTTFERPMVNSRDEALCGSNEHGRALARLHVIFFDNTLCQVSTLLKVAVMQILLAQLEAEQINPSLILDDPVDAVKRWSRDPSLATRCRMASGRNLTAVELQMLFLEDARKFTSQEVLDAIVPRAAEILNLWEDTLAKLHARDTAALAPRLDWVLKRCALERALELRRGLDWNSPEIKYLDQMYSSLDEAEGLYWAYERKGAVERVATDAQIDWFARNPPEDTRAWTRAMLLRVANPEVVDNVDWDFIRFRFRDGYWHTYHRLELANPLGYTRAQTAAVFDQTTRLDELLDALTSLGHPQLHELPQIRYAGQSESARQGGHNEIS
jgi:proteasome accessory factor A